MTYTDEQRARIRAVQQIAVDEALALAQKDPSRGARRSRRGAAVMMRADALRAACVFLLMTVAVLLLSLSGCGWRDAAEVGGGVVAGVLLLGSLTVWAISDLIGRWAGWRR
jgi:hypothetical protein